jgi:hypothetical protein
VEATQTPSAEHAQFDRICAQVEEWEPLPEFTTALPADAPEEGDGPLDETIMAGLVSPV